MIDTILNVSVHKGGKIIDCIVDTMVGDTSLRIVVSTDFGRTVAGRYHCLTFGSYVVDILLMLFVVDKGTQTC